MAQLKVNALTGEGIEKKGARAWRPGILVSQNPRCAALKNTPLFPKNLPVRDHPPDDQREHRRARRYGQDAQRPHMPWRPRRLTMLRPE